MNEEMTKSEEQHLSLQKALQQCELVQNMIDISISSLEGLRTKCATSNDLTQKEIRTLEVSGSLTPSLKQLLFYRPLCTFVYFFLINCHCAVSASICTSSLRRAALSVQCHKSRGHGAAVGCCCCWRLAHSAGGGEREGGSPLHQKLMWGEPRPARAAPCLQSITGVPWASQPARARGASQTPPPLLRKAGQITKYPYPSNWPVGCSVNCVT